MERHQDETPATAPLAHRAVRTALVGLIAGAALALAGCGSDTLTAGGADTESSNPDDAALSGYTREPTPSVADVVLPLVPDGAPLATPAAPGGLRLVYFGYTSCPDVCPTTMSDVRRALAELPAQDRERVEVVMVTVDPDRDVPEKLSAYVTTFVEDGRGARFTDPAGLAAAAAAFGVQYSVETTPDGEIEVGHSGDLYVVDDRGDVVLQWPYGISKDALRDDIATLLAERPERTNTDMSTTTEEQPT